jgi:hypothetical protein
VRKADNLTTILCRCLNSLEPSGQLQACNGTALPFTLHLFKDKPEDGPKIGPKHVGGIIIYNKILTCVRLYYIYFILYFNVDCRSGARWVAEINEGNLQKAVSHCKSQ